MDGIVRPSNSVRRRPQPMSMANIALFRLPRRVSALPASSNPLPCSAVNQFPTRTPNRRTPFTRRMDVGAFIWQVLPGRRFRTYHLPGRSTGSANQVKRVADIGSRPTRCMTRLVARPSEPVSKVKFEPVCLTMKCFSLSANSSNLGPPTPPCEKP